MSDFAKNRLERFMREQLPERGPHDPTILVPGISYVFPGRSREFIIASRMEGLKSAVSSNSEG
jgi:hypothetical protein